MNWYDGESTSVSEMDARETGMTGKKHWLQCTMNRKKILGLLRTAFNESELHDLCFRLAIDYEELSGQNKRDKARELLIYFERRDRLDELMAAVHKLRPHLDWSSAYPTASTPDKDISIDIDGGSTIIGDIVGGDKVGRVKKVGLDGYFAGGDKVGGKDSRLRQKAKQTPNRIVSTGFASLDTPDLAYNAALPLASNESYYFWFEVGDKVIGAINLTDDELVTEGLPPEAELDVVLFSLPGEIEIKRGADIGTIRLEVTNTVQVVRTAAQPHTISDRNLLTRRLFFPVHTPSQAGSYHLRCHVYYRQNLLQSWYVTAQVMPEPAVQSHSVLTAVLDYVLSKQLAVSQLQQMGEAQFSLLVNEKSKGSHTFRFFGRQGDEFVKEDVSIHEGTLQDLIKMTRALLREITWGDSKLYNKEKHYRYENMEDVNQFQHDLIRMAIRGYRLYDAIINPLVGNRQQERHLLSLMRTPGQVQISLKEVANLVIPVAMIYDYKLYDNKLLAEYSVCESFLSSLEQATPLEETQCFRGECPASRQLSTIVCPSGFWGYRHQLGLPVSVSQALDAPVCITSQQPPSLTVAVSTDVRLRRRQEHETVLKSLGCSWHYADSTEQILTVMQEETAQVVYFYCHGGLRNNLPFLSLGLPNSDPLTRAMLRAADIYWDKVRPLIFINGCHTTALEPDKALNLVSGFVETAQAAGVIGTEITIFESLAAPFAETFLQKFLLEGQTVGEAIRGARLRFLAEGNPLGLVYIPFVIPGLKLQFRPSEKVAELQDALEQWQAQILAKIEARKDLDGDEKEEMKEAVTENARKVLGEVQGQARPGRIERLLNTVSSMGDDILEVTVTTLADPFAGVGLVLKKIRERIKLEQAKEAKEEAA